ncbi:glycosyl hydrolase [Sulfuricaulis limicola]|uniref:Glycosyl hydrolase n=1 Tax=Sulfuricaulis limicola TaxID=1620215 RepID=A0A1B4XJP8_9GAMM|nr:glycoside hydrolase family 15 protein [Sulfuricaulis limicola]BAV35013.1 glycosyl hydrolase [Sulfuricaulis limicola]
MDQTTHMSVTEDRAPGAPGIPPTWTSSAKDMVGCALGSSRLWYSVGYGIVNEVYYPRIDIPQIRDLGFIVADDKGFWVEVKRLHGREVRTAAPGVPAVEIVHRHPRFDLTLRIAPDQQRDVLLIDVRLDGDEDLRPYTLLAPHLGGTGYDNHAAVNEYHGRKLLWAEQGPFGLALAAVDATQRDAWGRASAGYVGMSDGWQDFKHNGAMQWQYREAGPGNVALMGELPRRSTLALGFGSSRESAATLAVGALMQPFANHWQAQIDRWRDWHAGCDECCKATPDLPAALREQFTTSAMVLRAHLDLTYPGAMVASLSIPWGNTRNERGGYHLVWPRDLAECAGALLALGDDDKAREILRYLISTQHADGHWNQNQWLGGKPFWQGIQLDETAFPVLLAARLHEHDALAGTEVTDMVRRALGFIARTGPASDQDRWEEDAGVNAFTLAACIAALVGGARFLEPAARDMALALADDWNAQIEKWTLARGTELARRAGVAGYYVRIAPAETLMDEEALNGSLPIKNRVQDPGLPATEQVGTDFLQLVRFGLRRADDPLILDTLKVVDELLKVDTPGGPAWHRYNGDGYGEHSDGAPFDGTGQGRAWPLLTGERGHYELCAGRDPLSLLTTMASMCGPGGMMPEQVWDSAAIPARWLYPGRPTGSAMPLAWAHAEYIKLAVSRALGTPFDRPAAVWERYHGQAPAATWRHWCEQAPIGRIGAGQRLRICLHAPSLVRWSADGWRTVYELRTEDSGLGLHTVTPVMTMVSGGARIEFSFRHDDSRVADERRYRIEITG